MGGILGWSWSTGSNALHFEDEPASSLLLGSWALMRCCFCSSSATKERSNMYTDTHIEDPVITQQEECKLYKRGGISYSNPWSHIKKKKNWEEAKAYMQVKLIHIYIYLRVLRRECLEGGCSHVNRKQIGTMPTSNRHYGQQTAAWNTYLHAIL